MRRGKKKSVEIPPAYADDLPEAAPPPPPTHPPLDDGNLVICDANDRPITRINGEPRFRITYAGRPYEHFATDSAEGRWLYRPM